MKSRQVRLIDENEDNLGLVDLDEALRRAEEAEQDLVEIAGRANPPVCRIMDFGKFQYEEKKRQKEKQKKQQSVKLKEVQFHPNIEEHDYQTKLKRIKGFLEKGNKVKVIVFFRGREMAHKDIGYELMKRVIEDVSDIGSVDKKPSAAGRNIIMYLSP